jgi:hypothetical protein
MNTRLRYGQRASPITRHQSSPDARNRVFGRDFNCPVCRQNSAVAASASLALGPGLLRPGTSLARARLGYLPITAAISRHN